jgi:adenylate kinase
MVNEEKNVARERAIQIKIRGVKNIYKLAWTKERRLFRKKARQIDKEALNEIERHQSIRTTSGYVSSQERGTINQQKPSAGEMERTF